ncbi:RNA polymerase sigma factor [Streptomonospora algeriensis]|uniref:RNA polymerase sigma factor n=1 Tax=Streptomonospora algeriensis TaxID=995084 RepID=A0ABW3BEQ6_9ACTN
MAGESSRRAGPREAARSPDRFEEFYRRHVERITRFVARRVEDPHTAADLTADVFLAAIRSAAVYAIEEEPDGGVRVTISDLSLDTGQQRRLAAELREAGVTAEIRTPDPGTRCSFHEDTTNLMTVNRVAAGGGFEGREAITE